MKNTLTAQTTTLAKNKLFADLSHIIENRKTRITRKANNEAIFMFWEVGKRINDEILNNQRASYGKQISATVSHQLQQKYGKIFERTNLTRMMKFAREFPDFKIVATLSPQLSWSHIKELLPLEDMEAKLFYASETSKRNLGVRDMKHLIARKGYERREIANLNLVPESPIPFNSFRDPFLLDILGLKEVHDESDLETAIIHDLENFIMEFGSGFAFLERQKRMPIGNTDYHLDLLFYNREAKRLVAVELKIGRFKPEYSGQMNFYLKWLNEHERQEGEEMPYGLILCTEADQSTIQLMELNKSGIAVAEYWTKLPPREQFEHKLQQIMAEAKERLERRKQLGKGTVQKQINYFIEDEDNDEQD